jgi:hypothetical protein
VNPRACMNTVEKRKNILFLLGIEPRFLGHIARNVVIVPTELFGLRKCKFIPVLNETPRHEDVRDGSIAASIPNCFNF